MPRATQLTIEEQKKIIRLMNSGRDSVKIAQILGRDKRTIRRFMSTGAIPTNMKNNCGRKPALDERQLRKLKLVMARKPHLTSKEYFHLAGLPMLSRTVRCNYLSEIAAVKMMKKKPLLTKKHRESRMIWAERYVKQDFTKVIWTDETRVSLDGPDNWSSGWVIKGRKSETRVKRQQGGGGIMVWGAMCGETFIGPFRVPEGVKINRYTYCQLLEDCFVPWLESVPLKLRKQLVFMQDNAPSHASKFTKSWLLEHGLVGDRYMDWPPNSCDLNPIENLWAIVKANIYKENRQFFSKDELWKAIKEAFSAVTPSQIRILNESVDRRLMAVLKGNGGCSKY